MTKVRGVQRVGIVGWGDFGQFLAELSARFLPDTAVRVYSRTHAVDQKRFFSLADVCACDVVIITVPIHVFAETLETITPLLAPHSIVVDVATVKGHTTQLLRAHRTEIAYVATHPMFGPYSYEKKGKSVLGFRLVISEHTVPEETIQTLESWLTSLGIVVLHLAPDEHDRMLAETLFLTHFIAQGVVEGTFKRTDIDTVSFGFLMDAVESVKHDTNLFHDVYHYNAYCKDISRRFQDALARVEEDLRSVE